jgi:hypothetical protein
MPPQIGGFPGVRFDQRDLDLGAHRRHHQSGEAGAGAQIDEFLRVYRDQELKLGRIEDVPGPDVFQGGLADQVYRLVPANQVVGHGLEPVPCFT